jgi:thermitase
MLRTIFTFFLSFSLWNTSTEITDRKLSHLGPLQPRFSRSSSWDQQMIAIEKARSLLQNNKDIVVAVIDTGIDRHHPDLKDQIWSNRGETGRDNRGQDKATNGIDDDKNGFVDDVHGWNFVNQNNQTKDTHGHGSHVSGIITQIAPRVKIMALKYFDDTSSGEAHIRNTIAAIHYARQNGAHIINYSAGGLSENRLEKQAIEQAHRAQILFVAAAGNEAAQSDLIGYYPANYPLPNIISVTALGPRKTVVSSSNYSRIHVDIAAPGENIYSTLPGGRYGTLTGTSQATAFVSGVAALMISHRPDLRSPGDTIDIIMKSGLWNKNLDGKVKSASQLHAYRALTMRGRNLTIPKAQTPDPLAQWLPAVATEETPVLRAPSGKF